MSGMADINRSRFNIVIHRKERDIINNNGILFRCFLNSQQNACSRDVDVAGQTQ
jgi:hypothetical protein